MKKKKKVFTQVMAALALFAIVISIIGTGILMIASSQNSGNEISQQELEELLQSLSGASVSSGSGELIETGENILSSTGSSLDNLTGSGEISR